MNVNWRWIPAIVWGLLLVTLSLLPGGGGNFIFLNIPHLDKLAHAGIYAVWAFLILHAVTGQKKDISVTKKWQVVVFTTFVGMLLELGQLSLTIGRSLEIWDMIANGIGSLLGIWGPAVFKKR